MDKNEKIVLAIKTVQGQDLLGYFMADSVSPLDGTSCTVLYRPIVITHMHFHDQRGSMHIEQQPRFYFPFSDALVPISFTNILHVAKASRFYHRLYEKTLGELIVYEERREKNITDRLDKIEIDELMKDRNALYLDVKTEYLQ